MMLYNSQNNDALIKELKFAEQLKIHSTLIGQRISTNISNFSLLGGHVLKGETSKRNDRNETAETTETTETKRPKRNDRKQNSRKYKLQEKWKTLKYEIYWKFY
jgi:hypothetical protein